MIPLLTKIDEPDRWQSLLAILEFSLSSDEFPSSSVKSIVNILEHQGKSNEVLWVISEILECIDLSNAASASEFGGILRSLLTDQQPLGTDNRALAEAALSARRRVSQPTRDRYEPASGGALLAIADRFRATPLTGRYNPHPVVAWPSGGMSFSEFLLQWPCEIELPIDLDDATFVEEAYRAILLREPDPTEIDQYLRLIRDGVSKLWIIEDLLASEELRSLERRLRVICGDHVITEPGRPADAKMTAMVWPWRSAD
jgi:hypothetical protein